MFKTRISDQLRIAARQNASQRTYWLKKLAGEPGKTMFPYDFDQQAGQPTRPVDTVKFQIPGESLSRLMKLCKGSDHTFHMFLVTALMILINKYTGRQDIIVTSPIYKQEVETQLINTLLVLRNRVEAPMTIKELLLQVQQTIIEATKNYGYPIEILMDDLGMISPGSEDEFPLSDIALFMENIHDKNHMPHMKIIFSFCRTVEWLEGIIQYPSSLYRRSTIERISVLFIRVLSKALSNIDTPVRELDFLPKEEKAKLLQEFNQTTVEYPKDKTIDELLAEQAREIPQQIALSAYLDLVDIYEILISENTTININRHQMETLEKCCFRKNPYVFKFESNRCLQSLDLFDREEVNQLVLLRTHRLNYTAVNQWVLLLLEHLTGRVNLKSIFNALKGKPWEFKIYPVEKPGEEMDFLPGKKKKIVVNETFNRFIRLIKAMYQSNLVELFGYHSHYSPINFPINDKVESTAGVSKIQEIADTPRDNLMSPVLLLGDRTGQATTGLIYIASFLRRKGIEAYCRWNDMNQTRIMLKKNIRELLEKIRPKIVGVSMKWFPHIARVLEICQTIKAYDPSIKIAVGGNTASYYKEKIIRYECIDYVVLGDGEVPFWKICLEEDPIPNCVYKNNGKIIETPITYIQDEKNSSDIYLSHLDQIFVSEKDPYLAPYFYINTGKGCSMQCLYCAGSRVPQKKVFNRDKPFMRGAVEVRKDLIEVRKYTTTFLFDFDLPSYNSLDYYKKIWEGIDLSNHFCKFYFWTLPTAEFLEYVVKVFKYVCINIDLCSLSEAHRRKLTSLGVVKPQPTDEELFTFFDHCEIYDNVEIVINQITGLPYFSAEDIRISNEILSRLLARYSAIKTMDWGRLHAQPGAPIVDTYQKYNMQCYATTFEDFLHYSELNLKEEIYPILLTFHYPYIYSTDDQLNSQITKFYVDINNKLETYDEMKRKHLVVKQDINYQQLLEKSNRLARDLKNKGLQPGSIVGLLGSRSIEMIIGMAAVLRAGGAYLPIDPMYPKDRVEYMLADSHAELLLTQGDLAGEYRELNFTGQIIDLHQYEEENDKENLPGNHTELEKKSTPHPMAYVIYTSGSTGRPKGVMVEHKNIIRLVKQPNFIDFLSTDRILATGSLAFDISTFEIWAPLLNGTRLFLADEHLILEADKLAKLLAENKITILHLIPQLFNQLALQNIEIFSGLRCFLVGGDMVRPGYINILRNKYQSNGLKILHMYGPTENTTFTTSLLIDKAYIEHIPIGKPVNNSTVYILDRYNQLQPIGIPGELCAGGAGVARGYLNNPELTAEKFERTLINHSSLVIYPSKKFSKSTNDQRPMTNDRLYKTGDLARWTPEGNIEFIGRIDNQVKVRGYRIELLEIEHVLLNHESIREAIIVSKKDEDNSLYLCAYVMLEEPIKTSDLRDYLSTRLPDYMIPSYFIHLEQIPLTPNGKINRKALPDPEVTEAEADYEAPHDTLEAKLVELWANVLKIKKEKICINADFFDLGGHSLKATLLAAKIHQHINIKLPLGKIFKLTTIKEQAQYIKKVGKDRFLSVEPVEKKEYYPLSPAQRRLYIEQQRELDNIHYNMPQRILLREKPDKKKLEKTFQQLINRHESLRTSFDFIEAKQAPMQKVHEPKNITFAINYYEVREQEANQISKDFEQSFDLTKAPLLRSALIQVNGHGNRGQHILLVDMHHIISDGFSQLVLAEDFTACYQGEPLLPLKLQYKDYVQWQNNPAQQQEMKIQEAYWLNQYPEEIPLLNLPTDYSRPEKLHFKGNYLHFTLDKQETSALKNLVSKEGTSLFMVLLALYNVWLSKLSGQEDIVIGTTAAGRRHADLDKVIGMFVNTLPLRNYPTRDKTMTEFIREITERTLKAFENQDYPLEQLVKNVQPRRESSRNPLFDVMFVFQNLEEQRRDTPNPERINPGNSQPYTYASPFDLALNGEEIGEHLVFNLIYKRSLFKKETIEKIITYFKDIISTVIKNKDIQLSDIKISHELFDQQLEVPQEEGDFAF
jgi:amino acid adenylation domain-containing protein